MSLRQMELIWGLALCAIVVAAWYLLQSGARTVLEGNGVIHPRRRRT